MSSTRNKLISKSGRKSVDQTLQLESQTFCSKMAFNLTLFGRADSLGFPSNSGATNSSGHSRSCFRRVNCDCLSSRRRNRPRNLSRAIAMHWMATRRSSSCLERAAGRKLSKIASRRQRRTTVAVSRSRNTRMAVRSARQIKCQRRTSTTLAAAPRISLVLARTSLRWSNTASRPKSTKSTRR